MDLLIVILLILANGILSFSEMTIVSSRKSRLHELAQEKVPGARQALSLAESPAEFLSAIQVGITLVSTFAGAFGGVAIADDLAVILKNIEVLAPHSQALAVGIIVFAITFVSLVIGELVPKQIALSNPERLACFIAPLLKGFSLVVSPAVVVLTRTSDLILKVLRVPHITSSPVSENEIKLIIDQATKAQVVLGVEQDLVEAVLRLQDRKVTAIMTPRQDVIWIDVNADRDRLLGLVAEYNFSRMLVCNGDPDDFLGVIDARQTLLSLLQGEPYDLKAQIRSPIKVPEGKNVLELLQLFKESGEHFATVLSEYGGLEGIVTIHDVLQSIVGVVPESGQQARWEVFEREDGSYLIDGLMPVDEFKDLLDLSELPGEGDEYETLAGLVVFQFKQIPVTGDRLTWNEVEFEVVDMDGKRVDKVLVKRISTDHPAGSEGVSD